MENLLALLTYLFLISCAVERIVDWIKTMLPKVAWRSQRKWKAFLTVLGFGSSFMLLSAIPAPSFFLFSNLTPLQVNVLISVLCSSGSHFWHDFVLSVMSKNSKG